MLRYSILIIICLVTTVAKAQTDSIPDRLVWDKSKTNSKELIKLLTNPLDLQAFKKLKPRHSNSGGANKVDYYYKPQQKGFYYFYFVFNGRDTHGPRITTYQKGSEVSGYMDTAEVFIQLTCDRADKDLGKLDLVGSSINDLVKKFGGNYLKSGENWIYQYYNTILILHGKEKVTWFKVTLLNKSFKNFEEINNAKDLLEYSL